MRWWLGGPGAESLLLLGMTGAISRSGPRSTAVKPLCPLSAPALSDRGTGGTDPPSNSGFLDVIRAFANLQRNKTISFLHMLAQGEEFLPNMK